MKAIQWIDEVKQRHGVTSDYAAQLATGHAAVLRRQVDRLRGVVNKLENERTGRIIAVNLPVFQSF